MAVVDGPADEVIPEQHGHLEVGLLSRHVRRHGRPERPSPENHHLRSPPAQPPPIRSCNRKEASEASRPTLRMVLSRTSLRLRRRQERDQRTSFSHAMRTARRRSLRALLRGAAAAPSSSSLESSSSGGGTALAAPVKMGGGRRTAAARRGRGVGTGGRKVAAAAIGGGRFGGASFCYLIRSRLLQLRFSSFSPFYFLFIKKTEPFFFLT